jgi:hypothetical protein
MDWLRRGWDREHWIALGVGLAAGITLVTLGKGGLAEIGSVLSAVMLRWGLWQIPPPGRSRAAGTPPDGLSRLGQLAVAALLVTLVLDIVTSPLH